MLVKKKKKEAIRKRMGMIFFFGAFRWFENCSALGVRLPDDDAGDTGDVEAKSYCNFPALFLQA